MQIYLVGGAVRDGILGRPVHDRDYVVVGSTAEEMLEKGFVQVGADFPVFLHPVTGEEYALARTERKSGVGYKGFTTHFSPDVTLEEDLARRDLTINAMAQNLETGEIIDPYGGMEDIQFKMLRATTDAFIEDPLRILRLFRFKSQLGKAWRINHTTAQLAWEHRKELEHIPAERKWKEMEKALNSRDFMFYASMMASIGELPELQALADVLQPAEHHPEGDAFVHTLLCIEKADQYAASPEVKFATMCHDLGKAPVYEKYGRLLGHEEAGVPIIEALCARMKIPNKFRDIAKYVAANHTRVHCFLGRDGSQNAKPKTVMKVIEAAGNLNADLTHEKVYALADACWFDAKGRGPTKEDEDYFQGHMLLDAFTAVTKLDVKSISAKMVENGVKGPAIGEAIRVARIAAIRNYMWGRKQ